MTANISAFWVCGGRGYDETTEKYPIGWCIIEEVRKMAAAHGGWEYKPLGQYWVMFRLDNQWYQAGKFGDINKAKKRMDLIIDGEINPWE